MPKMIFCSPRVNDLDRDYCITVNYLSISGKQAYPVSGANKHFVIAMRLFLTWHSSDTQLVLISEGLTVDIALKIIDKILPSGGGARHPGSGPGWRARTF
jgi:hypothetical protein